MTALWRDVRFALRVLRKSPVFLVVAVLSLAVGIGAATAVYTVIDAALVRPLPVEEPAELVLFNWEFDATPPGSSHNGWMLPTADGRRTTTSLTYPMFERFREGGDVFRQVFAFAELYRTSVGVDGVAELATGVLASADYFPGLGLSAPLGRLLTVADDDPSADPAVVLDHGYWQRRFGGDPRVLGRPITVNAQPFTVVGVTPPGFHGTLQVGSRPAIYVPMGQVDRIGPRPGALQDARTWWVQVMARLRPGIGIERAEAEMEPIFAAALADEWGDEAQPAGGRAPALRLSRGAQGPEEVRREMAGPLYIAWGVCGVVLLIACANLAGLLLARSGARRREIAVRLSLGATRRQLIRQLLTETLLLSAVGAILGLGLAVLGVDALYGLLPAQPGADVVLDLRVSPRVLGFAAAATILTAALFGLAPALRASGTRLTTVLKDEGFTTRGRALGGRVLVVAQVALSLALLIVAGLFLRTLVNLEHVDPGFQAAGLLTLRVDPTLEGYDGERLASLYERMQQEISALPGVRSATLSPFSLIAGRGSWTTIARPDFPDDEPLRVQVHRVASNFLATMQIPLLAGRGLDGRDVAGAPQVAVVNQTFAREILGVANPVGHRFGLDAAEDTEVVGLSRDAKNHSLRGEILPTIYVPYAQGGRLRSMTFSVRTEGDPAAMIPAIRGTIRQIDPALPLFEVKTLDDQIEEGLLQERRFAWLAMLFGAVALSLSCIGLYGLLAQAVSQRTREFGIRQALGARRADLQRLILRELRLVALGLVLGVGVAFAAGRGIGSLLYGLGTMDPGATAAATVLLSTAALIAAYLPARRASRVDPMVALRED